MTKIIIMRQRIVRRGGFEHWHYYAQGPDTVKSGGRELPRRFDNSSITELRRVLRRAYGSDVKIVEPTDRGG